MIFYLMQTHGSVLKNIFGIPYLLPGKKLPLLRQRRKDRFAPDKAHDPRQNDP